MADELSETAGGATKGLLGALGFILILLGGELLLDKTGDRWVLGLALSAAGVPIFFMGVFWKWLQKGIATGVVRKVNWISTDPAWLIALFSVFTTFSLNQLGFALTVGLLALLGIAYAIYSWRKAGRGPPKGNVAAPVGQPLVDGQARLDLLRICAFAVTQTTAVMLNQLIELESSPEAAETEADWDSPHKGTTWYVRFVRQQLGAGTHRQAAFNVLLQEAEGEAEREIEAIPLNQRPDGVDPLKLRRRKILDLQRKRTVQFLKNQKRTAEESLVSQRTELVDQLDRWERAIRG